VKVLVDVDSVVCDLHAEWLRRYNADYNDSLTNEDIKEWSLLPFVKPECGDRIYDYLEEDLYGLTTPVIKGAQEGLERLRRAGDYITFVTSCVSPGMFDPKVEWLRREGMLYRGDGFVAVLKGTSKLVVNGDVLIDDYSDTVREFVNVGRIAVLFTQPWNRDAWAPARMESWDEVWDNGMAGFLRRKVMTGAAA
jgi:5'-nucleotidase